MAKPIPTKATKQPSEPAVATPSYDETNAITKVPHIDTHRAKRAVPRDAAIVRVLHTTLHDAAHVHDPIEQHEADRIVRLCPFAFAAKGLTDQMLLPIVNYAQGVLEGGNLSFQCDTEPVAPPSDRHASKLVRKRAKRRKQSYAAAMKNSVYGSYTPSRASSHTESRFGGSRFGGSRASVRGVGPASKMPKMSLIYSLGGGSESLMNSSWISSQQSSTSADNKNTSWLQGAAPSTKNSSPPSSVTGTARVAVDFVELQRRADIERDLSTRESVRRSNDELNRKSDLQLKLRSLADPTVSLEKEEAMMAMLGEKGQRSRLQQSRQGARGKPPGGPQATLSPLDGKRAVTRGTKASTLDPDETATFRTEDYEGLASDVVLFGKGGELLVGENCFVVEQKLRQELLLDLQTRGVVQPRIQLVAAQKPVTSGETSPNIDQQKSRWSPPPLRPPNVTSLSKQVCFSSASDFGDQIGSFESSPTLALDLEATPLAKGVVLKLPDTPATCALASKNRNAAPPKASTRARIPANATLEKQLSALIRSPDATKSALAASQSDPVLQTRKARSTATSSSVSLGANSSKVKTSTGAESPVLPKHIHNGEKHLQSLRIRTPACPNRLSRRSPSQSSTFVESDKYGWNIDGAENLFSLQEHASTSSVPNVKYVREFPKPPQGRIQLFGALMQDPDWKLPTPSPFSLLPSAATVQHKRRLTNNVTSANDLIRPSSIAFDSEVQPQTRLRRMA